MSPHEQETVDVICSKIDDHGRRLDEVHSDVSEIKDIVLGKKGEPRSGMVVHMALLEERLSVTNARLGWIVALAATSMVSIVVAIIQGLLV